MWDSVDGEWRLDYMWNSALSRGSEWLHWAVQRWVSAQCHGFYTLSQRLRFQPKQRHAHSKCMLLERFAVTFQGRDKSLKSSFMPRVEDVKSGHFWTVMRLIADSSFGFSVCDRLLFWLDGVVSLAKTISGFTHRNCTATYLDNVILIYLNFSKIKTWSTIIPSSSQGYSWSWYSLILNMTLLS